MQGGCQCRARHCTICVVLPQRDPLYAMFAEYRRAASSGYAVSGWVHQRIEEVSGWNKATRQLSQDPSPRLGPSA